MSHAKKKSSRRRTVRAPTPDDVSVLEEHEHGHQAKPISFWPLDFETALEGLLAVPWPPKRKKKKRRAGGK